MDNKVLRLTYASALSDLKEANSSFDSGILQIAYAGVNRNGTSISREAFEKAIPSMYNCPVVCNYDRETDTLGGHDVEVVRDDEGELKLINMTTPVGVIPESAKYEWRSVTEEDGSEHEYLCVEALLWKRQEAYEHIKESGVTSQSMEITVLDGEQNDGIYDIKDFEFTAFALIGVEPCFESASIKFSFESLGEFKEEIAQMMTDLKQASFAVDEQNDPSSEGSQENFNDTTLRTEGGEKALDEINENAVQNDTAEYAEDCASGNENQDKYALNSAICDNLSKAFSELTQTEDDGWVHPTYLVTDFDMETSLVYAVEWNTGDMYGFKFTADGDNVSVDFESRKRYKRIYVEAEDGYQTPERNLWAEFASNAKKVADFNKEIEEMRCSLETAESAIKEKDQAIGELTTFKANVEKEKATSDRQALFANFSDLSGNESFEALVENCMEYDLGALEEKCFAIRGKTVQIKSSHENEPTRIRVFMDDAGTDNRPYGDLFEKYDT